MAAVRSLRVSVKPDSGPDHSESDSDSDSDRGARESEPMEVEEGELEVENIPVNRSLKELLPVREVGLTRSRARVPSGACEYCLGIGGAQRALS